MSQPATLAVSAPPAAARQPRGTVAGPRRVTLQERVLLVSVLLGSAAVL